MPFAGYDDFDDCVAQNQDKDDPEAYCGKIKSDAEMGVHDIGKARQRREFQKAQSKARHPSSRATTRKPRTFRKPSG